MSFSVPKKTRILWQLRCVAAVVILCAAIAAFSPLSKWLWLPCGIMGLLGVLLIFIYLPAFFANCRITVGDDAVMVTRGVFIQTTHIMPYPRMIYAQSFTTPAATAFGLCGVTLKAARGIMVIPEMEKENAELLLAGISGGK